ncbi:transposable element Tcb1 transposase [Trichonephila clavipes]|nr:transposable element Tcb1 transposase [Trichonephila clavipes]
MVWGGIMFDYMTSLVHRLAANPYATDVVEPVVLPLLQGAPNMPANSQYLNPIEHLWNLIERDMNRGPLAQTMDDLRTVVDVASNGYLRQPPMD